MNNFETENHKISDKNITLTPLDFIRKLGDFDLDPCGILTHKTAKNIISLPRDGLKESWSGRVWLNPPYSNPKLWLEKLSSHKNGIALILSSTGTKWFQDFVFNTAYGILFLKSRPKFTRLDYSRVSIMRDCVLVAYNELNYNLLKDSGLDGKLIKIP